MEQSKLNLYTTHNDRNGFRIFSEKQEKISLNYYEFWYTSLDTGNKIFVSGTTTFDDKIYARIGYIISSIWTQFNVNLDGWMFSNCNLSYYDEDEVWEYYNPVGFFDSETMKQEISYSLTDEPFHVLKRWNNNIDALKQGIQYNGKYSKSFPTRWLYEDFEEELKNYIEEWKHSH